MIVTTTAMRKMNIAMGDGKQHLAGLRRDAKPSMQTQLKRNDDDEDDDEDDDGSIVMMSGTGRFVTGVAES